MLLSISRKLLSEKGSAVIGFALGAPLVLLVFVGFTDLTHKSVVALIAQTSAKLELQKFSVDPSQTSRGDISILQLEGVEISHFKGSFWNLWRVKE
jgi:hypothetical protein